MSAGLAVYSDPSDYYEGSLGLDEGETPFQAIRGWILNLSYDSRSELPRPMQREVARAGWEIAAADAYPVLMPFFTPGGGLSRDLVRRLTAVLRALTSFADEYGSRLREGSLPFRGTAGGWRGSRRRAPFSPTSSVPITATSTSRTATGMRPPGSFRPWCLSCSGASEPRPGTGWTRRHWQNKSFPTPCGATPRTLPCSQTGASTGVGGASSSHSSGSAF